MELTGKNYLQDSTIIVVWSIKENIHSNLIFYYVNSYIIKQGSVLTNSSPIMRNYAAIYY